MAPQAPRAVRAQSTDHREKQKSIKHRSTPLALVRTVFLRYLDVSLQYLTVSPRISLHLIASPRISPYLPVSARIRPHLVSPGISRYLPVSRHIPPYPAADTAKKTVHTRDDRGGDGALQGAVEVDFVADYEAALEAEEEDDDEEGEEGEGEDAMEA